MKLELLGWDEEWAEAAQRWPRGTVPARITADYGIEYEVTGEGVEGARAVLSGPLRNTRHDTLARPGIGDWIALVPDSDPMLIVDIGPRRSEFVRKAAGEVSKPQLLAANVDIVFVVTSLNQEFNIRRIERYTTAIWDSGATPVVVLNKADLVDDPAAFVEAIETVAPGVETVVASALSDDDLGGLEPLLGEGKTVALVGSSGVGKSTILNRLVGGEMARTAEIRLTDDEGRHTTTHREMVVLSDGRGLLIDSPGMREFGLWSEEGAGLDAAFEEIAEAAQYCRFNDCKHEGEPGCAVLEALEEGDISEERLRSWRALQAELDAEALRSTKAAYRKADRDQGRFYKSVQSKNPKKD